MPTGPVRPVDDVKAIVQVPSISQFFAPGAGSSALGTAWRRSSGRSAQRDAMK